MSSKFPMMNSPQLLSVAHPSVSKIKIPLKPGHSLMDWIRLTKSGSDLRGTGPRMLRIPLEELRKHNKLDDAWMAIRGFVYNVTSYMHYHPGGPDELMKGVGMDATALFEEIHRWVNFESMLKACLIGKLEQKIQVKSTTSSFLMPPPSNVSKLPSLSKAGRNQSTQPVMPVTQSPKVKVDWFQSAEEITIVYYTQCKTLNDGCVVCDIEKNGHVLKADIFIDEEVAVVDISLANKVEHSLKINAIKSSGNVEIKLTKSQKGLQWEKLSNENVNMCTVVPRKFVKLRYRCCELSEKTDVTHDTCIYHFRLPDSCYMRPPIGCHVYLQLDIEGVQISKPYTVIIPDIVKESEENPDDSQRLCLMVKTYTDGTLTPTLKNMKIGENLLISTYEGDFKLMKLAPYQRLVLLCGGTGFTPMIRVLQYCLKNTNKMVHLSFYNKKAVDILWKEKLETLVQRFQGHFSVEHILSQPGSDWNGKTGRVMKVYVEELVNQSNAIHTLYCVCGPPPFMQLCDNFLNDIGVKPTDVHVFTS